MKKGGAQEDEVQALEMVGNRWTVKQPGAARQAEASGYGGTKRNNLFGSIEITGAPSL